MWNESDHMWPGSYTGGIPMTAERIRAELQRQKYLELYLAVVDDRVAGYCRLGESREEDEVAYVALLNVHPAFQKRGLARDLLRIALEHASRDGYRRIDLHTWAGNMLAVPLYKKSGYFWVADTSVHMENYVPLLLRTPFFTEFFAKHDWYSTQVRDLGVHEDDRRQGGMKVYPYRWEADGEVYEATIDAEGKSLTAFSTPRWRVVCRAPRYRLHPGIPQNVRWEIERRDGQTGHVTLLAEGEHGLTLHHEVQTTVHGLFITDAEVAAEADAIPKPGGQPAHRITTTLVLDGTLLRLQTGQRIGPAVEVVQAPRFWSLCGTTRTLHLRLRNHLEHEARGSLSLTPPPGVSIPTVPLPFLASAGGYAGVAVPVAMHASGCHRVGARFDLTTKGRQASYSIDPIRVGGGTPGQAVAGVQRQLATLENSSVLLTVRLLGGGWSLQDKQETDAGSGGSQVLGPPFDPSQRERQRYTADVEHEQDRPVLVLRAQGWGYPGVRVEHRFRLLDDRTASVCTTVMNGSKETHTLALLSSCSMNSPREGRIVVPLPEGVVVEDAPHFPDWREDVMEQPSALREPWLAVQSQTHSAGVFWTEASRLELGRLPFLMFTSPEQQVRPGQSHTYGALYATVSPGHWQTVRDRWRDMCNPDAPDHTGSKLHALDVSAGESALTPGEDREIVMTSRYSRALPLVPRFIAPTGWTVEPAVPVEAASLIRGVQRTVAVQVRRDAAGRSVAALAIDLGAGEMHRHLHLPLMDPGVGPIRTVQQELDGHAAWTVENNVCTLWLVPSFGSAVRLDYQGQNQVYSAFPEPREFIWMRPWYGGIAPFLFVQGLERWEGYPDAGTLPREQWTAAPVTVAGASGSSWQGVRLETQPTRAGYMGLTVTADYLLPPAAPVLALRLRVVNTTSARISADFGFHAFLQPGGRREARLVYDAGTRWELEPSRHLTERSGGAWAAVVDADAGIAVALTSHAPAVTMAFDAREQGAHLGGLCAGHLLEPGEAFTSIHWLSLGGTLKDVESGRVLKDVVVLP